jgi:hypothetical protein
MVGDLLRIEQQQSPSHAAVPAGELASRPQRRDLMPVGEADRVEEARGSLIEAIIQEARAWYWTGASQKYVENNPAEWDGLANLRAAWREAALREFISNEDIDVRRCILPGLPLSSERYPADLHPLVAEAIRIARTIPTSTCDTVLKSRSMSEQRLRLRRLHLPSSRCALRCHKSGLGLRAAPCVVREQISAVIGTPKAMNHGGRADTEHMYAAASVSGAAILPGRCLHRRGEARVVVVLVPNGRRFREYSLIYPGPSSLAASSSVPLISATR